MLSSISKIMKLICLTLFVVLLTKETTSQPSATSFMGITKRMHADKYCGQKLPNTLSMLCSGFYNGMFEKRDGSNNNFLIPNPDDYAYNNYDEYETLRSMSSPFISREDASSLLSRLGFRRWRRQDQMTGIYNECCLKSCTLSELLSYCGNRPAGRDKKWSSSNADY